MLGLVYLVSIRYCEYRGVGANPTPSTNEDVVDSWKTIV